MPLLWPPSLQAALEDILGQMADWPPMQCLLQVRSLAARELRWVPCTPPWTSLQPINCACREQRGSGLSSPFPPRGPCSRPAWAPLAAPAQGDVGCGKTAVAFLALLAAAGAGYQGAIMVGAQGAGAAGVHQPGGLSVLRAGLAPVPDMHMPTHKHACVYT